MAFLKQQDSAPAAAPADLADGQLRALAPRPLTVEETGLSRPLLCDLISKHLYDAGVLTIAQLCQRTALAGPILEELIAFLRQEGRIEVRAQALEGKGLRYALTDRGRASAAEAFSRGGYLGTAPVPLDLYRSMCRKQSVHAHAVTKAHMREAFKNVVIEDALMDQLGPALNSGRAIFVYGPAGTGKTYITQKLARLINDRVLIPNAICIDETIVQIFDPVLHEVIDVEQRGNGLIFEDSYDPRFRCCRRPVAITGGELDASMLEISYDADTREYRAPLQLRANNGIFIIDDMGRQRVEPEVVLNRWIVPLEEKIDYHSLGAGKHFSVPFDVILVFSTNINPLELADEAFLRRIGYKIRFDALQPDAYKHIWQQFLQERGLPFDPALADFTIAQLHQPEGRDLLPCHPRDLLTIALDRSAYLGEPGVLSEERLSWAWANYFVKLEEDEVRPS